MTSLPRSLDELRGLRAARWIRESKKDQEDNFGPDAQRHKQDQAIERYGLTDTGIAWQVAHSGRTIGSTGPFGDMMAKAGQDFDVLVVGYVSRFSRDLETSVTARRKLHEAGAAILFADERVLSSDEDSWEGWAREAVESESYSRKLSRRVTEGYASKYDRHRDPGGRAPIGFYRETDKPHRLVIDPETIGLAVALFTRYATGAVSMAQLSAETGVHEDAIRDILRNPLYNGWAMRKGERVESPWRSDPPVPDKVWQRVEAVRERNARAGGPRPAGRIDPLGGLLYCADCGKMIRANGTTGGKRPQRLHPEPCEGWGHTAGYLTDTWLQPLEQQITGMKLDDSTIEKVVRVLTQKSPAPRSDELANQRIKNRRKRLAEDFANGKLDLAAFTAAITALDAEGQVPSDEAPAVSAEEVVATLRAVSELWAQSPEKERANILRSIFEKVEVRGKDFTAIHLKPDAEALGLALLLPEEVERPVDSRLLWRARPDSNRRSPA
jgi:DNA invertase Pin-like site-specific DNA recombinase